MLRNGLTAVCFLLIAGHCALAWPNGALAWPSAAASPVEDKTPCPPGGCVPWEAPDGGARTFVFERPDLPHLPPEAQAEWVQGTPSKTGKGKGVPRVLEHDFVSSDDRVCPVQVAGDGSTVSVTIENHLPGLLTTSGEPPMVLNGGFDGACIEIYAKWKWREVIGKLSGSSTVLADGTTVPGPPREMAFRYKYHWALTCQAKVCPC